MRDDAFPLTGNASATYGAGVSGANKTWDFETMQGCLCDSDWAVGLGDEHEGLGDLHREERPVERRHREAARRRADEHAPRRRRRGDRAGVTARAMMCPERPAAVTPLLIEKPIENGREAERGARRAAFLIKLMFKLSSLC